MIKFLGRFLHTHYHARYHGVYQHAKQLFVFDMGLLLLAFGMLVTSLFLFFWKPGLQDKIALTVSLGDARVSSGQTVDISIAYANHSKYSLTDGVLSITLPPGFIINRSSTPESVLSAQRTMAIPRLLPGGNGTVIVSGKLWTTPGHEESIIARYSYTAENTGRREQKLGSSFIRLPESILVGSLTIATSSFPGATLPYTYTLTNTSAEPVSGVTIRHNWFVPEDESEFTSITIAPHASLSISGEIRTPAKPGPITYVATPEVRANGTVIPLQSTFETVDIISPSITARVQLPSNPAYVDGGQQVPVEVTWKNSGRFALTQLTLALAVTPGVVDMARTARENHILVEGDSLVIDSQARTALANGSPGGGDQFTLQVYLLPTFSVGAAENAVLKITPSIRGRIPAVPGQIFSSTGESASAALATQINLSAQARYYTEEGDQLGRGPLPPVVGQSTKYWVFVQAYNTTNAVRDARFTAVLPPGVTFTGKQSVTIGKTITYSESDRTVRWNHSLLPANSQTGLYFEVAATPQAAQLGKNLLLLSAVHFTATDDRVNKSFNLSTPDVYNTLSKTDRGALKGSAVLSK